MRKRLWRAVFWLVIKLGQPFGGFRPARILHFLGRRAYKEDDIDTTKFYTVNNRFGDFLKVHPFYHIDRNVLIHGCYDRSLHNILMRTLQTGNCVLDVGANIGEVSIHMARLVGQHGIVHAFEPAPPLFERLSTNVKLNNLEEIIRRHRIALGAGHGKVKFHYAPKSKENQGMGSLVNSDNDVVTNRCLVDVMALDQFVKNVGLQKIDFIKVDIQGGEIEFLRGAETSLRAFRPALVVEVSAPDLAATGNTPKNLLSFIENLGYRIFEIKKNGGIGDEIKSRDSREPKSLNVYCKA